MILFTLGERGRLAVWLLKALIDEIPR